jgi:outer membrane protein
MQKRSLLTLALLASSGRFGTAQQARRLTLADAEDLAIRNHPRISSASLIADASRSVITEVRSSLFPTLTSNFTGVGAEHGSTLAVGAVQTSSLYSRAAVGFGVTQLVTDFGRTSNLVGSAKLRAAASEKNVATTRATVRFGVDQAYYQALAANSVLKVAQAVVENRRLTLRQVRALAQSSLKSTLDVSFAEVAVSDAELALVRAENDAQAGSAYLSGAIGSGRSQTFDLVDEPLPPLLGSDAEPLVADALRQRPDLASLQLTRDAAQRLADAEKALSHPTVSIIGVTGALPATDPRLKGTYSAAGINVSVPILNGHLFSARRTEAELRAEAADRDVDDLTVQISEQVRVAWLEANTAFRRLDATARLVAEVEQALRLARTRYDIGLGSIVELNQSQLSEVSAQIAAATAKYDYLSRRAALAFVMGAIQ